MAEKIFKKYGIGVIFLIFSLVIIIFGVIPSAYSFIEQEFSGDYVLTVATIDDSQYGSSKKVYVCYEANGVDVRARIDTYHSEMDEGDKIDVLYNKNQPEKVSLKHGSFIALIASVLLSLAMIVCGFLLIKRYYSINNNISNNKSNMLL